MFQQHKKHDIRFLGSDKLVSTPVNVFFTLPPREGLPSTPRGRSTPLPLEGFWSGLSYCVGRALIACPPGSSGLQWGGRRCDERWRNKGDVESIGEASVWYGEVSIGGPRTDMVPKTGTCGLEMPVSITLRKLAREKGPRLMHLCLSCS